MRLKFAPLSAGGPVLPSSVNVAIEGRAMLVIKFDEIERIRYSDYRRVVELVRGGAIGRVNRNAVHIDLRPNANLALKVHRPGSRVWGNSF